MVVVVVTARREEQAAVAADADGFFRWWILLLQPAGQLAKHPKLSHLFRIDTWLALLTLHLLWPALACFVLMHYLHSAHMHCLYK